MSEARCQLHEYDYDENGYGKSRDCGRLAVSIWKSRDGDLFVCEQCEAMVMDTLHEAKFEPLPTV
jgi:hypothetical protein